MQKIFSETTVIKRNQKVLKKSFLESQMIAKTNALIFVHTAHLLKFIMRM